MFNLYLYSQGFSGATVSDAVACFEKLNTIVVRDDVEEIERFLYDAGSLCSVQVSGGENLMGKVWLEDKQFVRNVLPKLLTRIEDCGKCYHSLGDLDAERQFFNAFFGHSFPDNDPRHLSDKHGYDGFRERCIEKKLNAQQFVQIARHGTTFPNLIFSDRALEGVSDIADKSLLRDVVGTLWSLNSRNAECWRNGYYDYKLLSNRISSESESTMNNPDLRKLRCFVFPDKKERCCELHIKINRNTYRIHICPEKDGDQCKVYVGYIGPHLRTSSSS